jgi:hypothetical protein
MKIIEEEIGVELNTVKHKFKINFPLDELKHWQYWYFDLKTMTSCSLYDSI